MALQASINVTLALDNTSTYDVSLEIPSGLPTKDAPYTFSIDQTIPGQGGGAATTDNLLTAVIGDTTHFYVALAPPASVLSGIEQIKELDVVVNDGGWDTTTHKFTS